MREPVTVTFSTLLGSSACWPDGAGCALAAPKDTSVETAAPAKRTDFKVRFIELFNTIFSPIDLLHRHGRSLAICLRVTHLSSRLASPRWVKASSKTRLA